MRILRTIVTIVCLGFTTVLLAQDPDLPPDDGSGTELDVPLSGSQIFFIVALGVGGLFVYKQQSSLRRKLKEK